MNIYKTNETTLNWYTWKAAQQEHNKVAAVQHQDAGLGTMGHRRLAARRRPDIPAIKSK